MIVDCVNWIVTAIALGVAATAGLFMALFALFARLRIRAVDGAQNT